MRIGTMFFGEVESLDNENIQTKFFVLGVPLIPLTSFYVIGESGQGVQGLELPAVHGKSALFGFARVFLGLAALLCGVFSYLERDGAGGLMMATVVLTVAWVVLTFFMGKLSDAEKKRRVVLRSCVGIGAPPEILGAELRKSFKEKLLLLWQLQTAPESLASADTNDEDEQSADEEDADDRPSSPAAVSVPDWRGLLVQPTKAPRELADILYALARYHGEEEAAERLWEAHQSSDVF